MGTTSITSSRSRSQVANIAPKVSTARATKGDSGHATTARVLEAALATSGKLHSAVAGQAEVIFKVRNERVVETSVGPEVLQRVLRRVAQEADRGLGIRVSVTVTIEVVLGLTEPDDEEVDVRLDADGSFGRAWSVQYSRVSFSSVRVVSAADSSAHALAVPEAES
ncbi:uncharacterized protein BP01DRAFT_358133 [Aspergillus saccharolyticus JOP 1030-1]|uniref:Uncharacterized protein n=1 Tax=Aspergillus saccharolyticus JOP 1030-1 TaxID=1450539 RepID=A0A318Z9E3_9EURO|nr:hypothetical protein BP01DRAFT_358133 [Aspergillus saccharolyticus JOP 1030-1]PYH43956.1 hypothetical protein BP01DRAFT_358133 [Aspergillus saccharolyticus JOP 1030-1]